MTETYCGEPRGYNDPPCSKRYGMCDYCIINNQAKRIEELKAALSDILDVHSGVGLYEGDDIYEDARPLLEDKT